MSKAQTPQEQLVASFARHSVGAAAVFYPDHWPGNYEPADLIFYVGRTVFMLNMYAGNKRYENATKHNIEQARKRLRDWRMGKVVVGKNDFRKFNIIWKDVDDVVVVSIVDCREARCETHLREAWAFDPQDKVAAVATLTVPVIKEIAKLGGGAREIVDVLKSLCMFRRSLTTEASISMIQTWYRMSGLWIAESLRLKSTSSKFAGPNGDVTAFDIVMKSIMAARQKIEVLGPFAEISWSETAQLASTTAECVRLIDAVPSGAVGPSFLAKCYPEARVPFGVSVARNSEISLQHQSEILDLMAEKRLRFWMSAFLDSGFGGMFIVEPDETASVIKSDIAALAALSCGRVW